MDRTNFLISKIESTTILLLFSIFLISCSKPSEKIHNKFTVKDDAEIEVIFDSYPQRIISLGPNITETIFAIGADSLLVGVTEFCDYPEAAKSKVNTGSYLSPDYEVISSLKPDLIIVNVEAENNPTYQSLKNMGYKLFLSHAKDISGIYKMIRDLGIITNKKENSENLINEISNELKESTAIDINENNALILIAVNPMMSTNNKTFINEIINLSGFNNIYAEEVQEYPVINFEDVVSKDPDVIIFPTDTLDAEKSEIFIKEISEKLKTSSAVRNNKIILIDDDIMFRPGPRITDAVRTLRNQLHR